MLQSALSSRFEVGWHLWMFAFWACLGPSLVFSPATKRKNFAKKGGLQFVPQLRVSWPTSRLFLGRNWRFPLRLSSAVSTVDSTFQATNFNAASEDAACFMVAGVREEVWKCNRQRRPGELLGWPPTRAVTQALARDVGVHTCFTLLYGFENDEIWQIFPLKDG